MTQPAPPESPAPTEGVPRETSRRIQILAGLVFAALVVVVLVVVVNGGKDVGKGAGRDPANRPVGVAATSALLKGIPQHGLTLGDPQAPVTIVEFIDLQCPYCAAHQNLEQPKVIDTLVRPGKARLTVVPLAFLGPDSEIGRTVLLRLARKNVGWNFINLALLNQGAENSGYMDDAYLRKLLAEIPGATAADRKRTPDPVVDADRAQAQALGKAVMNEPGAGTPYFIVGPSSADPRTYARVDPGARPRAADSIIDAVQAVSGTTTTPRSAKTAAVPRAASPHA